MTSEPRTVPQTTRAVPGARDAVFAQLADAGRAEQVARRLADAIVLGVLAPGERLPSEAELARRFGVALVTTREGLGMLRQDGLLETRRGRDGGSFVVRPGDPDDALLTTRLRGLSQVELGDLAVYVTAIAAGCADRAAERATAEDDARLRAWLAAADFSKAPEARRSAGGFLLELAVLSQSTRLVREQLRLQAEFGPLLWLGMRDAALRTATRDAVHGVADAVAARDAERARAGVSALLGAVARWLLAAKARIETGGAIGG
ncbi:GntR family transcriptional regulator [Leifsonia shinshuensis]|uniref:FadR/GntR family transcriptional regulator n=1 Tax=Leifsonia shinshuensis TaxID=150026 RepID=UPI00285D320C|nr:GntR family transcriptional regulator [Leifsonia shinshuensis]MDR6970403.1 DNA-binding FadR family transcriptional regulator [Leifsonia shinshuensis]